MLDLILVIKSLPVVLMWLEVDCYTPINIMSHYPPTGRCWGRSGYLNYEKFKYITSYRVCCSVKSQPSPHLKDGGLQWDLHVKCSHFCTAYGEQSNSPCKGQVLVSNASPSPLLAGRKVVWHNLVIGSLLLRSKYSRTSIIRISIIWTLSYPNTIFNFKIPRQFDFLQNQAINDMSVWFLDLLGLLYHSTVGRNAY